MQASPPKYPFYYPQFPEGATEAPENLSGPEGCRMGTILGLLPLRALLNKLEATEKRVKTIPEK